MSHVHISRRCVLIALVVFGLLFLAAQVCLLKWAGTSGIFSLWGGQSHKHPRQISPYMFSGSLLFLLETTSFFGFGFQRAAKVFADASSKFGVPVFLIEPDCLTSISLLWRTEVKESGPGKCKHLCGVRNVTTFGVLGSRLISQEFLSFLEERINIHCTVLYGPDPRLVSVHSQQTREIPLHYLFEYSGHFLHLVVFYERSDSYLWHGATRADHLSSRRMALLSPCWRDLNLRKLKFGGAFAGAYDKMEFRTRRADGVNLYIPRDINRFLEQIPFSRHLECDYDRAAAFGRGQGRDETREALDFRQSARDLLEKGKRALDGLGIRFWLSSGTCLGWFRECDIIAHSQDVDFGMWIKDYDARIIQDFDTRGLTLKHQFGRISDSFELSFMDEGIKLDIFFFYEERDHMWNGGTEVRSGNKYKYSFPKFTLCWAELLGLKVRVPCDTQRYIEANYGEGWNQKVTTWDWKSSPPNVRPNEQWDRAEWDEVIQVF